MKKNFCIGILLMLIFSTSVHAAKWQTMVFSEDISRGIIELERYCVLHDVKVEDVMWANSINSSADIQAGTSIFLPANQADLLNIWQNQGAWKPTALVPVTSAAAAKKIAVEHEKKVEAKKKAEPAPLFQKDAKIKTSQESTELQAKLEELMRGTEAPKPIEAPKPSEPVKTSEPVTPVTPVDAPAPKTLNYEYEEIIREMKVETPQQAIAQIAKPDSILTAKPKNAQTADNSDPIIVLSPNGNASQGPMRLLIVGDKVEVVRIPENAAPKNPTVTELDHVFGTTPAYIPYYDMTTRRDNGFAINYRALNGKMMWPVDGKVSSFFGMRGKRMHEGIDIPMPVNTPIRAARNGVVSRTGNNSTMGFRGYGNFVLLDHGAGLQSFYAHCSSVAVKEGQRIMQGQIIGYVGSTGRSTANHLHFEVRVNNAKVDPMPYLAGNNHFASRKK